MNRKIRKIGKLVIATMLILSMLSTTVSAAQASSVKSLKFRTAVVTELTVTQGTAEVTRSEETIPMYDGMRLSAGDTLKTTGDAVAYIMIDQNKIIRLDAGSEAELTDTLLGNKVKITLKKGSMFFNVVEKLTEDESLQFVYGNVTISVRGTSALMQGSQNTFDFVLADGEVTASLGSGGQDGKVQEVQVKPGQKFECSANADGSGSAPVVKLSNVTLNELPKSLVSEMKKDPQLAQRVISSTPVSSSPSGNVYGTTESLDNLQGVDDAKAMEVSEDVAKAAGVITQQTETKEESSGGEEEQYKQHCSHCGAYVTFSELQLKHRLLPCGHYGCDDGDHTPEACGVAGHYKCRSGQWEEHILLPCGHCSMDAISDPKLHAYDAITQEYPCQHAAEYTATCAKCGAYVKTAEEHKLPCGHYCCEAGYVASEHAAAACGTEGHYVCDGKNHAAAACGEHYQCAEGYVAEEHAPASCGVAGHYACDGKDHTNVCGERDHNNCDGNTHTVTACGHCSVTVAQNPKLHTKNTVTGEYPCQHAGEYTTCPQCGAYVKTADEHRLACGHYSCTAGYVASEHVAAACGTEGHYVCDGKNHAAAACGTEGHYNCDGKTHAAAACGEHYQCAEDYAASEHAAAACGTAGHYNCDGKTHTAAACGEHYQCAEDYVAEDHQKTDCGHCALSVDENPEAHRWDEGLQKFVCQIPVGDVTCAACQRTFTYSEYTTYHLLPCGYHTCEDSTEKGGHKWANCMKHCACQTTENDAWMHVSVSGNCGHALCEILPVQDGWKMHLSADTASGKKWICQLDGTDTITCPGCGQSVTVDDYRSDHLEYRLISRQNYGYFYCDDQPCPRTKLQSLENAAVNVLGMVLFLRTYGYLEFYLSPVEPETTSALLSAPMGAAASDPESSTAAAGSTGSGTGSTLDTGFPMAPQSAGISQDPGEQSLQDYVAEENQAAGDVQASEEESSSAEPAAAENAGGETDGENQPHPHQPQAPGVPQLPKGILPGVRTETGQEKQ